MDRQIEYAGQILTDAELLTIQRDSLIGLGWLAQTVLGTGTNVVGLACNPTSPASMSVQIGTGAIYALENLDNNAYGSLAADTTSAHQIVKQGLLLAPQTFTCAAPSTAGQSIIYLIEAAYEDYDTNSQVLQFFDSANPSVALTGPGGTGTAQNTTRQGLCSVQIKAGVAATTGAQTAPAADSGYVGLYAVTVSYGATTVTSGNIAALSTAPFIAYTLPQVKPGFSNILEFTNSGTWTVPVGITRAKVRVWGAGGGSGSSGSTGSGSPGGGGGGGYTQQIITGLVPGTAVAVTVGAGGIAPTGAGGNGGTGGTSSFGSYLTATGGSGGGGNSAGTAGQGGGGSGGTLNLGGSQGSTGSNGTTAIGGSGGGSPFGVAGTGGATGISSGGQVPGGGAGAAGATVANQGYAGGAGLVIVEW